MGRRSPGCGTSRGAAYAGIPAGIIERVTGRYDGDQEQALFASRPWRWALVAERARAGEITGYASYGPEPGLAGLPRSRPADHQPRARHSAR